MAGSEGGRAGGRVGMAKPTGGRAGPVQDAGRVRDPFFSVGCQARRAGPVPAGGWAPANHPILWTHTYGANFFLKFF